MIYFSPIYTFFSYTYITYIRILYNAKTLRKSVRFKKQLNFRVVVCETQVHGSQQAHDKGHAGVGFH